MTEGREGKGRRWGARGGEFEEEQEEKASDGVAVTAVTPVVVAFVIL